MIILYDVVFDTSPGISSKMESLPEEMLFTIFQNLHPLELIHLSRVNRRWHDVALNPRLHRSVDFSGKRHLSSATICKYISKYKHSLQELNLQECYWLKGGALSSALQKCRKLTSLNVLGCSVTKKTLCSVLKLNSNLTTLAWSITASDLYLPPSPISRETFRDIMVSFCRGLATGFTGLDRLMIRFPVLVDNLKFFVPFVLNLGMPLICRELSLKRFALQWFDVTERAVQCVDIVIEGDDLQFQQRKQPTVSSSNKMPQYSHDQHSSDNHLTGLQAMSLRAAGPELERGTLHTFVLPHFDYFVQSDNCKEHIERMETKSSIVNMDLGALGKQDPDRLTTILGVQSLRYLNLTGMNIVGHMLQVIATSSPNLEILNLQDCRNCITPIQGLESLAMCCTNLAQLNLKGVHYSQDSKEKLNHFMEIISKFTSLTSLSICNCVLGSVGNRKSSKRGFKEEVVKRTKRVCHGRNLPDCQSSYDPATSSDSATAVNDTQTQTSRCERGGVGTFDSLTQACSKITEFELIRTSSPGITFVKSYYRSFNRALAERCTDTCYTIKSTYDTLSSIANWKSLQRLTLAAPFMQCSLECLVTIARNCVNLQFLSLATLANLGHSGNVALLQEALSCCHQLRDFRLEQPHFKITESFLLSLGESKHLERVCIIARHGPMKIDSQVVVSLFEKCYKLYYFHVLCDITIKASKVVMDSVKRRFVAARPGLIVSVVPFRHSSSPISCQVQIVKSVPVVHLKELFLFGTSVATSVPA